ncbi:MAG: hypothetical protein WC382_13255 [Methanoregulaceae archaeon]|jgi:hypothetical protein
MNIRYRYFILIGILLFAGVSTIVAADTISVTPASSTIDKGSSTTFQIGMDSAPDGISGYYLQVSLSNPSIAEITGVSYPSWVTYNETIGVPSDTVTIAGGDVGEQLQQGASSCPCQ